MSDDRLPTDFWVGAHLRRLMAEGLPAYIVRRGDRTGGTVLLKLNRLEQGCEILTQTRDLDGRPGWMRAFAGAAVAALNIFDVANAEYYRATVRRNLDIVSSILEARNSGK